MDLENKTKIWAEIYYQPNSKEPVRYFLLGEDKKLYEPTNWQQYINPFKLKFFAPYKGEETIDDIMDYSKAVFEDGTTRTQDGYMKNTKTNTAKIVTTLKEKIRGNKN